VDGKYLSRDEQISKEVRQFARFMEERYECTGVCGQVPVFRYSQNVTVGSPRQTCDDSLKENYLLTLGILAIGLLVCCFLVFIAFNA
jgi:hypothetical protein